MASRSEFAALREAALKLQRGEFPKRKALAYASLMSEPLCQGYHDINDLPLPLFFELLDIRREYNEEVKKSSKRRR